LNLPALNAGAPVWYLMGPTASGKTELAIALSERFPFEIISVDSSMVYCDMDIGTAKPKADILARYPHHLISIRSPRNTYSAADFCVDARSLIGEIHARDKFPLLVGGTMFYFRALEYGLPSVPKADPVLRRELEARGMQQGWASLYRELEEQDPERAAQIEPGDKQRIQRALEIVALSGKSATTTQPGHQPLHDSPYPLCKLALAPANRTWLHRRIEQRFESMLKNGLIEEVRNLLVEQKLGMELAALRMVGYRQVVQYLLQQLEYNEMERRGIAATRQLAKRQMTWLRNQRGLTWMDCTSQRLLESMSAYISAKLVSMGR